MTQILRRCAALAAVALLLSGCSSSNGDKTATGTPDAVPGTGIGTALNNTTAPQLPITLELAGCLQLHTFFPFPVAMFGQLGFTMPDGFQYDSADGQTVNVVFITWSCTEGRLNHTPNAPFQDVASMFAAMPVRPPSDLTAGDAHPVAVQLDLLPLFWVINVQLAANHLGQVEGLRDGFVEFGDVEVSGQNMVGPVIAHSAVGTASFGAFSVDTAVQSSPGSNGEGRYRMWLAPDGTTVTGHLDIVNGAGTTVGAGYADLRFQGQLDTGAPPATGGTSHVVQDTPVLISYVNRTA